MYPNARELIMYQELITMGFEDHREAVKNRLNDNHVVHLRNGQPKSHSREEINALLGQLNANYPMP